ENEIYQEIKGKSSKEEVYEAVDKALKPFTKNLLRAVTTEDIIKLTELPFMRISRYDQDKAIENLLNLEGKIEQVKHHLNNLITYAIDYFI
ncbi:MAG TPA: DNA gyrase/topoisomerase IV subunit A, partial [Chryseobacterium sp.]|nr:DNA gyrase/topoisomerase IV subunit A [Chryseobacterium sp.]